MNNRITTRLTKLRILAFTVLLLTLASLSIVASVEAGFIMQGPTQTAPAKQTVPAEQNVEQVQKNILVLNGLPQSQLVPVMNYMASSLGVKCTYCHVKNGDKWDFVSDAKSAKGTARE